MRRIVVGLLAAAMCLLPQTAFAATLEDIKAVVALVCQHGTVVEDGSDAEKEMSRHCTFTFEDEGKAYSVFYLEERRVYILELRNGFHSRINETRYLSFSILDKGQVARVDANEVPDIFEKFVGTDSETGPGIAYGVENEVIAHPEKRVRKAFSDTAMMEPPHGPQFREEWQQVFDDAIKVTLTFRPRELALAN